jgi:aromatic-amino-acid transaminase
MLKDLKPQVTDKIVMLMQMFRDDPRRDKVDLGVGVYKDASGNTPVMRAVKAAEQKLWQTETTKTYTALAGDPAFADAMRRLVLGDAVPAGRVAAAATPGGTGAVRQALEMIHNTTPAAKVWISTPTWPNHPSIISYVGIALGHYRYFDAESGSLDFAGMMADLDGVSPGDVVLLHGCCHNPTGANLTLPDWRAVTDLLAAKGAIPLIDIAYQGFGDGLQDDAAGLRHVAATLPEVLIAASCSKNFGIYRERTGVVMALAPDSATRDLAQGTLAFLNRQNYSFPPDHGARLVTMILNDPALRADWQAELEDMRLTMRDNRKALADALRAETGSDRFGFLASHRGMFSLIGASKAEVRSIREDFGVYLIGDGRMNVAGLTRENIPQVARAIAACCKG